MTKDEIIYELASIALWAGRRTKTRYYEEYTTDAVKLALESVKDESSDIRKIYEFAGLLNRGGK